VLVLVETDAERYICAFLAIFTKSQRLSKWWVRPIHKVWMHILQKLSLQFLLSF